MATCSDYSKAHIDKIARERGIYQIDKKNKEQLCAELQSRFGGLPAIRPVTEQCKLKPITQLQYQAAKLGLSNFRMYNEKTKQELCDRIQEALSERNEEDEFKDINQLPSSESCLPGLTTLDEFKERARQLGIQGYQKLPRGILCHLVKQELERIQKGGHPRAELPVLVKQSILSTYNLFQVPNESSLSLSELSRALTPKKLRSPQIFPGDYLSQPSHRGLILFHSVGTGKTFSAINTSQLLLRRNIVDHVIVITPTSLQINFQDQFMEYNKDLMTDTRYQYFTPQKFASEMAKPMSARKIKRAQRMMLIIDEAHNYRTYIWGDKRQKVSSRIIVEDDDFGLGGPAQGEGGLPYNVISNETSSNRVRAIFKFMTDYPVQKVLLLTATPFVNSIYDIENLVSMIENRPPRNSSQIENMTAYPIERCLFHVFKNTEPSYQAQFPRKIIQPLFYSMSNDYYEEYLKIQKNQANSELYKQGGLSQFYNGVRRAANKLDFLKSDKLVALIDLVTNDLRQNPSVRILIYSSWLETGLTSIKAELDRLGIRSLPITGKLSKGGRNHAVQQFNSGQINVLLISKAGGEGLNLKKTNKVYILEPTWNDASIQQIIGRAVRFQSHIDLPLDQQVVRVYYMMLLKPFEGIMLERGGDIARKLRTDPNAVVNGKYSADLFVGYPDLKQQLEAGVEERDVKVEAGDSIMSIDLYLYKFLDRKQKVLDEYIDDLSRRSETCFQQSERTIHQSIERFDAKHPEFIGERVCLPKKSIEHKGQSNRVIIEDEDSCAAPSLIDLEPGNALSDTQLNAHIRTQIKDALEWKDEHERNIVSRRIPSLQKPSVYDERLVVDRIEDLSEQLIVRFPPPIKLLSQRKKIQLVAAYDIELYRQGKQAIQLTLFYKGDDGLIAHEILIL